jgi:pSer/pThr/pTyr-binding forkhead associated (FHA) protein
VPARPAENPGPRPARVTVAQLGDFALKGQRVIVGRLASNDITIPDHNVSREHAEFVQEGNGWAIEDLGSTNGTYVNGEEIQSVRLREGDHIRVGVTEMVFHEADSAGALA